MTGLLFALSAWLWLAAGFTAVTHAFLGRRRRPAAAPEPRVLLLRPADALGPHELELLARPLPVWVRQVVLAPFKPSLPSTVEWLPSDPLVPNRKAGHLAYALATLDHEGRVVLTADADVAVDEALLRALSEAVVQGAALSTAAPWPLEVRGLGGRALRGLLVHSHQSFEATAAMRLGAPTVCGKAMGLGTAAQAEFAGLGRCIGEDLELSQRLHRRGERVVTVHARALTPRAQPQSLAEVVERLTRWMQVLRAHRPWLWWTVPLLLTPTPIAGLLWLAAAATETSAQAPRAWPLLALVALRAALALRLAPRAAGLWEWLWGEAVLAWCWLRSLPRREVVWRGRRLRVLPGGGVVALPALEAASESPS